MNRKYIMVASSVMNAAIGLGATFLPVEILNHAGITPDKSQSLIIQIMGALYVGFAMLNWMAKTVLIGGIYAKPIAVGNFTHFMIASVTLIKFVLSIHSTSPFLLIITTLYSIFAVLFGIIAFTHPAKNS